jgi:nucleotide-binding universal stress UspA family protein
MTIKDALLYISPNPADEMTARFAAGLAQHFGAEVTGLTFAIDVPYPAGLETLVADRSLQELREKNREDAVVAMTHAKGVFDEGTSKFIGVMETCLSGEAIDSFVEYARLRDIAILPNRREKLQIERPLIEAVLFGSGLPVMLIPEDGRTTFAVDRILIAWDYSRTAARAVADAMPLLTKAKRVHILTVSDDKELRPRMDAHELARHLARHGVAVVVDQALRGSMSIGDALFRQAAAVSADLLVMGGFGHSRLRAFILGGATQHVLTWAPLPILMSH